MPTDGRFANAEKRTNAGVYVIDIFAKVYELLNQGLFHSKLPAPQFSPTLTRKDIFRLAVCPYVFEIGTGIVTARPVEIIDDLLHNMVHVFNHMGDEQDVTANQYHNLVFCEKALDVGLIVNCHKTRGWGVTHTDPDAQAERVRVPKEAANQKRLGVYDKIELPVEDLAKYQRELQDRLDKPIKQFQFKYVCKCKPPMIVRVGTRPDGSRPYNATCNDCNTNFVLDESRPAP